MHPTMYSANHTLAVADQHGRPIATLYACPAQHLLTVCWEGNLTAPEVVRVAKAALELRQRIAEPLTLLLNDKSGVTGDWSEALPWLEFEWLPQAVARGLQAIAYVFSVDVAAQIASREFVKRIGQSLPVRAFADRQQAEAWLLNHRQVA